MITKARYQSGIGNGVIRCELCPHGCSLLEGGLGICKTRGVKNRELVVFNYGEVAAMMLDPIEKKPLYNYKPGSKILSIGSYGCNLRCGYCQNSDLSMGVTETKFISPTEIVEAAIEYKRVGNIGIAFTYNEPSTWFEYIYDTAKLAKEKNLEVVVVSNGFINQEPLLELIDYVDAMNIDLKSFNESFYTKHCGGNLEDVIKTIEAAVKKCHIEITTLLVNGYNDTEKEIGELSSYIAKINREIPLHLTKYYPRYKFTVPETPSETILGAVEIAKGYLDYVYPGSLIGETINTYCPGCGEIVINRGARVNIMIRDNMCPKCGKLLNIVL